MRYRFTLEDCRRGFFTTVARHWGGCIAEYMAYLRRKAAELEILRRADDDGATCIEVPVILDPEDDPTFEYQKFEPLSW